MYAREKPCREENYKPRKNNKNMPSFSSTLLDEIYRSIDGNAENSEDFKSYKEKPVKRQSSHRPAKTLNSIEDEEMASFRRACLVEKWMEKDQEFAADKRGKPPLLPEMNNKSLQDDDLLFFSSTSSSSDSSGTLSSSSDTEFFGNSAANPKVSCFSTRPKPVRTGVSAHKTKPEKEDSFMFEDNCKNKKIEDGLFKSRSRAMKIYANLKKVKQPISPGGRLTSFINSLFSNNANGKKTRNYNIDPNKGYYSGQDLRSPKAVSSSTCSSASSFSRSCLSKYSPKSREKMRHGIQRTVRFHPVGVIVDEESRPCGKKSIYDEGCDDKYGRPPLPPNALSELRLSKREKIKKVEEAARNASKGCNIKRSDDFSMFMKIHAEDEDYDGMSDSSSDLFEIDHLALFGDNRFCEELPVYETTHFDTNRAIASRLIH